MKRHLKYLNIDEENTKKFLSIVGNDLIGATIKNVYDNNLGCFQYYSSCDDGHLFIIEYVTANGEKKYFSIGNGNLKSDALPTPIYGTFIFGNDETINIVDGHDDNPCECSECNESEPDKSESESDKSESEPDKSESESDKSESESDKSESE